MPTLKINIDPAVLARLLTPKSGEAIEISVVLGEADGMTPTPVSAPPTGELAGLMAAGLLKAGEELAFRQPRTRREGRATVTEDAQILVEGSATPHKSVSSAAEQFTGNVINGWTLWRTQNGAGPTLAALRRELREGNF